MVKLYEKLGLDTVVELMPEAKEKLLELGAYGEDKGLGGSKFTIDPRWHRSQEVGVPLLRYVHTTIISQARQVNPPIWPWTHMWSGSFASLVRNLGEGVMTNDQVNKLATQLYHILKANRLVERIETSQKYFVAEWPEGFEPKVMSTWGAQQSKRDAVIMEKRIVEEADKPVEVIFDLSVIPTPKDNPHEVIEYVKKLKSCFDKLRDELEQTKRERDATLSELIELKESSQWAGVGQQLHDILEE